MIGSPQAEAQASGARLVLSCGSDSVPFDLGVWFNLQQVMKEFARYAPRIRGRVRNMQGLLAGGTFLSFDAVVAAAAQDPALGALVTDPLTYTSGFKGLEQPDDQTPGGCWTP
jgi:short subunit dehydrogenase-like uncharacterized protein